MKSLLPRNIEASCKEHLEYFPCLLIEGARQVGKSTLAHQLSRESDTVLTLDDDSVRAAAIADPQGFVESAGSAMLVIDEIQRCPDLTLAIKASIDRDRRPGRFILTGSSRLLRARGTVDSLAGRVARFSLFGLSQGEQQRHRDDFISRVVDDVTGLASTSSELKRTDYAQTLAKGSFPDAIEASDRLRATWLDSYLAGLVQRDMPDLRRQFEPDRAWSILRAIAARPAAELVKARIATEASLPAGTITGYLDLLHDVGLVASLPPWTPNLTKREVGRHKTLVIDSALAMRLSRTTAAQIAKIEHGEVLGALLEAFVAAELLRQQTWSNTDFRIFHFRDRAGLEVDFVIELDDGSIIGIEVKASATYSRQQFTGLKTMRDGLGERFVAGIVLGTAVTGVRHSDRLYGVPISVLWEA